MKPTNASKLYNVVGKLLGTRNFPTLSFRLRHSKQIKIGKCCLKILGYE